MMTNDKEYVRGWRLLDGPKRPEEKQKGKQPQSARLDMKENHSVFENGASVLRSSTLIQEPAYMERKQYLEPGDGGREGSDLNHGIALPGPGNSLPMVCLQGRLTMIEVFEPPAWTCNLSQELRV